MKDIVTKRQDLRKLSWTRIFSAGWIGGSFWLQRNRKHNKILNCKFNDNKCVL